MARPKGVIQARDEKRYWLPQGVSLKPGQDVNYRKETYLWFIDDVHGEFWSTYKAIQGANASTHPKSVSLRREATNIATYGVANAGGTPEARKKAQDTMERRTGKRHALQTVESKEKAKQTSQINYGCDYPMRHPSVRAKVFSAANGSPKTHSKGEYEVRDFINSLGYTADSGFLFGVKTIQVDILEEQTKIAVEFNGCFFHHMEKDHIDSQYHLTKTEIAEKEGYRMIHIFDVEWKLKKEQIKSYLKSAFNKNTRIYGARECYIKELDNTEAFKFMEDYHILGKTSFNKAFGLFLKENDELVSLASVGKHHWGADEWILNRYVGKENVTVAGGLSKLSSHIKKEYGTVYTWVDRRFSDGSNWIKCGWKLIETLKPGYFFYDPNKKIMIKKENITIDKGSTTKREAALLLGFFQIYDCGKYKMELK